MKIKANKILAVLCVIAMVMTMIVPMTLTATAAETATLSFASKDQRTSFSTSQQIWEQNGITFTNSKKQSTSNIADYANPVRLYANTEIIIEAPGNITTIVFDCNSSTYATNLKTSIGDSATVSSKAVTVTLDGTSTVYTLAKLSAQVRLNAVTVTYTVDEGACAHENYTTDELVEATCTEDGSWTYTCTSCGETIHEILKATGHNFVNETCTKCTAAEFTEMTIPEALAAKVGVGAIISNVEVTGFYNNYTWNGENCSVYVEDEDGQSFLLYRLSTKVEVGNIITAKGYIGAYNNVNQLAAGGTAEILVSCAHANTSVLEGKDATCTEAGLTEGEICNECGVEVVAQEEIPATGHNFVDDACSVCGATKPNSTTVSVSIEDYATANSWSNSLQYETITADNFITITADGGGNTGKFYTNGNNWRLYQGESAKLIINAAEGCTILSVKISYTSQNTGCLTYGGNTIESDQVIEVNATSVELAVGNTTADVTNGQARITAIEVVYAAPVEEDPSELINEVDASMQLAYKYVEENGTIVDSLFVLNCSVDAKLADIATTYGIKVTDGTNTVYYTKDTSNSWNDEMFSVSINLGDMFEKVERFETKFTVCAFIEVDGVKYESTSTKTYSVADMVEEYYTGDNATVTAQVEHLYNILAGYGLYTA